ncbi:MAG: gliding motility-associated C-terminal domain-containing protein, partial [Bacteroidetes bacterium]|nr:gliding motility-associated C-terminal domain-containing protein [Bacteroidota bacterium]
KNPYLDVSQPGSYLAKLSSGCDSAFVFYQVGSSSIKVQVQKDLFEIKLGENIQIDASVSNSGNQTNFQWIDPQAGSILCTTCLSTSAQPFNDLQYIAIASNELGCTDSALVRVRVKKDRNIYFPNVINPQNAQTEGNGYFYASGDPFTIIEKLSVYSRWGEKLFENSHVALNDPYIGWNGIIRGQAANPGVYVWVAEVLYLDGVRETFQGDVTVVR